MRLKGIFLQQETSENAIYNKGKVIDLVFPILSLIVCCVIGMIYSGGFFSGTGFVEAFSESDASVGLMLGSFFAMVITIVFYVVRKVLRFSDSMACIPEGFKAMVPAINLSLYGRSSLRRSLFTYFRYNNHGIRRCAV